MVDWRAKAREVFPEMGQAIDEAENPYALWIDLCLDFEKAYQEPRDEGLIRRIYSYAEWCEQQDRGETAEDDLLTCVAVCFYEHIPTIAGAREDMPRWFTLKDVEMSKGVFGYFSAAESSSS